MISKIFSFCIVYVLSVLNFFVILSPLTFSLFTKYFLGIVDRENYIGSIFFLIVSCVSFLMLIFFLFDFLFNSVVNHYIVIHKNYQKYEDLYFLRDIFEEVKERFDCKNVLLLIDSSDKINAYAVGSMTKKVIIITSGLLKYYKTKSSSKEEFMLHMKGILAHEMSHLINKDYFCGLFLYINEQVLSAVSKLVFFIFSIIIRIVSYVPVVGRGLSAIISRTYKFFNYVINFFYYRVVKKIYNFAQTRLGRNIEFRSDRQASMLVGGEKMAKTLELLGPSGWFNIFSSHPTTQSRVRMAKNVNVVANSVKIKSMFYVNFLFIFSFFIITYISLKSFKLSNFNKLSGNIEFMYEKTNNFILNKKLQILMFIQNINNK